MTLDRMVGKYARSFMGKPFEWGQTDCNVLVLGWCDVVAHGVALNLILGKYGNKDEAISFAAGFGRSLSGLIEDAGFVEIDTRFPRAGDVLIVDHDDKYQLAHIALGSGRFLSANETAGCFVGNVELLPDFTVMRFIDG